MTPEQIKDIIAGYNASVKRMQHACDLMDSASPKSAARADTKHTFELGQQAGIDLVCTMLGYHLETDDEDMAIALTPYEQE